jgi:hypothetical protein
MALQSVTLKYSAKKANGQNLQFTSAAGALLTELVATDSSASGAKAQIAATLATSVAVATAGLDDLVAAQASFDL